MTLPSASVDLASERTCEAPSSRSTWRPSTSSCARAARAAALTTGIALLAGLGACGGKADANPTGIQQSDIDRIAAAASHQASASASAGTSSPASASTSPADYTVPEAAKAHTKEGAKAFVKFYMETLDRMAAKPENGIIERYAAPNCAACSRQAESVAVLARENAHIEDTNKTITDYAVRPDSTNDSVVITFHLQDGGNFKVTSRGQRTALPRNNLRIAARADWLHGQWKMGAAGADKI